MEPGRCLNCEAPVAGEFCSACGQRNVDHRRPLRALLRELVTEAFELDGRMRRTLVPFFFRPGLLTREFRAGRRVRYTSPLRLYIATSLLCFSMIALRGCFAEPEDAEGTTMIRVGPQEDDDDATTRADDDSVSTRLLDRARAFGELPPAEARKRFIGGLSSNMPKALLLLVPVFAGLVGLLTIGRGFLYVDHLVFALHLHSFWFTAMAIAVLTPTFVDVPLRLAMFVYGVLAFRRAYELRWGATIWRVLVGSLLYGIALLVALFGVLVVTIVS